jgi:hypothetical protein
MENPVTAETFMEAAVDFCDRNSFDKPPAAPRSRAPSGSGIGGNPSPVRSGDAQEDEALQAALRASMEDGTNMPPLPPTEAPLATETTIPTAQMTPAPPPPPPAPVEASIFTKFATMTVPPEPPSGGSKISFRLCSSRKIRSFPPSTTMAVIFAFVAQEEGADGKEFELRAGYPPKVLDPEGGTVEEMKLEGETVTMRWKD